MVSLVNQFESEITISYLWHDQNYSREINLKKSHVRVGCKWACLKAIEYYIFALDRIWQDETNWAKDINGNW